MSPILQTYYHKSLAMESLMAKCNNNTINDNTEY